MGVSIVWYHADYFSVDNNDISESAVAVTTAVNRYLLTYLLKILTEVTSVARFHHNPTHQTACTDFV